VLEKGKLAVIAGLFADQIGFGLEAAVAADMIDGHPMIAQDAPNQQSAVAAGRILFAAQEGHPAFTETLLQAREAFLKKPGTGHTIIEHMAFAIVEFGPGRPSAQFFPHVDIADAVGGQSSFQNFPIELGRVFRIWLGARVHDDPDLVILEQAEEDLDSMIGMPYSQGACWELAKHRSPAWISG
jgi:hypothetical protein